MTSASIQQPSTPDKQNHYSPHHQYYDLEDDRDARLLDLEVQKRLIELSQELLLHFYTLMRTLTFHSQDNEAVQHNLYRFHDAIREIFEHEYEIHVEFTGTDFLINERWSKLARRFQDVCNKLGNTLKALQIGGFWISGVPDPQQLLQFVERVVAITPEKTENPFSMLQTQLWRRNFDWITLEKYCDQQNWETGRLGANETIRQTYFQAVQVVQQLQSQAQQDRPIKLKSAKRVVQSLIDLFDNPRYEDHLDLLQLLTHLKDSVDYRYSHPVNVAILSIGFGHHLGLQRTLRRDLGIAALLYDTGLLALPQHLLEHPPTNPTERQKLEQHPELAIPMILHTSFIDSTILRTINTTFGHHLGAREGGYPAYGQGLSSLAPQLIAIADMFDNMCSPQPHKQQALTPTEALAEIARMPEQFVSPMLSRQFVNWLGPLPLGSLVRLHEGSIGYVCRQPEDHQHRDRPFVKVLQSPNVPIGSYINLNEKAPTGRHFWNIQEILQPQHPTIQQLYMADILNQT